MQATIQVQVLGSEPTPRVPDTWSTASLRALLGQLVAEEGGAWTDAEVPELLTMALQDLPANEAGEAVLAFLLGDRTSRGQRDHMVAELGSGRAWEKHAELANHLLLFQAAEVLHPAHAGDFTTPVAQRVEVLLTATDEAGLALLGEELSAAVLCRLLAAGDKEGILNRLFGEALGAPAFPEAPHVAWRLSVGDRTADTARVEVVGSHHWFGGLPTGASWVAETWADPEEAAG